MSKILKCHFYHINKCNFGDRCKYSHHGEKLNYCPNGKNCYAIHQEGKRDTEQISLSSQIDSEKVKKNLVKQDKKKEILKTEKNFKTTGITAPKLWDESEEVLTQKPQEKSNTEKSEKKDKFQILNQNMISIHQEISNLQNQQIKQTSQRETESTFTESQNTLDLQYLVDISISNEKFLEKIKKQLISIIEKISISTNLRVSIIGFRDKQTYNYSKNLILPFSNDITAIVSFIKGFKTTSLEQSTVEYNCGLSDGIKQDWQADHRICVIIANKPNHTYFHPNQEQIYFNHPYRFDFMQLIYSYAYFGIKLYAIRFNCSIDYMYNLISPYSEQIDIINSEDPRESFGFYLGLEIQSRLENSEQKNQQVYDEENTCENQIETNDFEINFPIAPILDYKYHLLEAPTFDCIVHSFFFESNNSQEIDWKNPQLKLNQQTNMVRIAQLPFCQGSQRYVFFAQDFIRKKVVILKLNQDQNFENNSISEMNNNMMASLYSQYLGKEFNERILKDLPDESLLLKFKNSCVIQVPEARFKHWYYEDMIEEELESSFNDKNWVSTNKSLTTESALILQAFSHFTWQISSGNLIIVNPENGLSGCWIIKPKVHCLDDDLKFTSFGNQGKEEITNFFKAHECNQYCKKLGLVNPKVYESALIDFQFFEKNQESLKNKNQEKKVICQLCSEPFKIRSGLLHNIKNRNNAVYCEECYEKNRDSRIECKCLTCNRIIQCSLYWYTMKKLNLPNQCDQCRQNDLTVIYVEKKIDNNKNNGKSKQSSKDTMTLTSSQKNEGN